MIILINVIHGICSHIKNIKFSKQVIKKTGKQSER